MKKRMSKTLHAQLPIGWRIALMNLKRWIQQRPVRISRHEEMGVYAAQDSDGRIHFCRLNRARRYKRTATAITDVLWREYHLDRIGESSGTFIDCGANIGELGIASRRRGFDYIAFEPEDLEASCCDLNNFSGDAKTNRLALWHEATKLTFYQKPEEADSSLFEMDGHVGAREVRAERLDAIIDKTILKHPVVIKVEAEGAEPEVLKGMTGLFDSIDYVAIDCGYERGREKNHTFVESHSILTEAGFEVVAADFKRVTFLYGRA